MKEGPFQIAPPQRSAIKQRRGKSQVARFSLSFSPSAAIGMRARSQSAPKCVRGANKVQGVCVEGKSGGATFRKWKPIRSSVGFDSEGGG